MFSPRRPFLRACAGTALVQSLLLGTVSAAPPSKMWTHAIQAVGQMVEGQLTAAVGSLARAKKARPAAELDALVGLIALSDGRRKLAAEQLSSGVSKGSTEPLVFYWAARAELQSGRHARALKHLRAALSVAPKEPAFHMARAMVLSKLGRGAEAADALVAAAREQPNVLDPSLYPSAVEGAVDLLGVILRRFPSRAQVVRTQGHLLWRAGRVTAACRRFDQLLAKHKGDADALQMAARCKVAFGQTAEALGLVGKALERAPGSAQALAIRGEILLEQGKAAEAVKDLRKAADRLPTDGRLLARLAQACSDAEQPRCARKFFTYALRRQPRNAAAAFGLALHLQLGKDVEKTAAAFRRALSLAPENPRYLRAAASFAQRVGKKKLAQRWLADARYLDRARARFEKTRAGVSRTTRLATRVSALIRKGKGCKKTCRRTLHRLPAVPRQFAEAHLALRANHIQAARKRLAPMVPRFHLGVLLLKDPAAYEQKARTRAGVRYVLRIMFPCIPSWRL